MEVDRRQRSRDSVRLRIPMLRLVNQRHPSEPVLLANVPTRWLASRLTTSTPAGELPHRTCRQHQTAQAGARSSLLTPDNKTNCCWRSLAPPGSNGHSFPPTFAQLLVPGARKSWYTEPPRFQGRPGGAAASQQMAAQCRASECLNPWWSAPSRTGPWGDRLGKLDEAVNCTI